MEITIPTSVDQFEQPMTEGTYLGFRQEDVTDKDGNTPYTYSDGSIKQRLVAEVEYPWNRGPNAKKDRTEERYNIPEHLETGSVLHAILKAFNKELKPFPIKFKDWEELVGWTMMFKTEEMDFGGDKPYELRVPAKIISDDQGRSPTDKDFGKPAKKSAGDSK